MNELITKITQEDQEKNIPRFMADLFDFEKECLGYKDLNEEHRLLCRFIQFDKHKFKLILMPRHSFKSCMTSVGYSLWRLLREPDLRILLYSDSQEKACGFLMDIKNHVEGKSGNSVFRDYIGAWEPVDRKNRYNEYQISIRPREAYFKEPSIDTAGIETSKVGMHYDLIIFDDIVTEVNTTTKDLMDKVNDTYRRSLALLKPGGEVVMVGTRWHFGDAYGRLIQQNKITERFGFFVRDAEMRRADGDLIFKDIGLTETFLKQQREELGSTLYSCLYRNSPIDAENALFKIEDFQFYKPYPDFHKNLFITATCDPAGEGKDFTGITVCGTDCEKHTYLLEAVQKHLKPSQIVDEIIRLNYKWGFDRFAIETNFYDTAIEESLRNAIEEERKNQEFKLFSVVGIKATRKDTTRNRILRLQPLHETHSIFFPGEDFIALRTPYSDLAYQMLQFTSDGSKSPHDDLLVSLSLHLEIRATGGTPTPEGPPPTSAAWLELQNYKKSVTMNRRLPRAYRKGFEFSFN